MRVKAITKDGVVVGHSMWCPACDEPHVFLERMADGSEGWRFNGNMDKPSFTPSLKLTWRVGDPSDPNNGRVCHSVMSNGIWHFDSDSTHALAGKTADAVEYRMY